MNIQATKITITLISMIMTLAACGGGGGGGSEVAGPPAPPPDTGGITGTGIAFAIGPVTGFGSVIVNGVTYDTSAAAFTQDGAVVTQAEFKVGQYVLVQGTIDQGGTTEQPTQSHLTTMLMGRFPASIPSQDRSLSWDRLSRRAPVRHLTIVAPQHSTACWASLLSKYLVR